MVTDSVEGVTEYTYDAMGQLLTEIRNGETVNAMAYDNYGNILQKNGIRYTYSEGWNDRLAYYDGEEITYDAQGNPLNYLGHTLTWEKGRQLKSFDGISFTYNANGIRTSKTVDGVRHDYLLDGVNILRETWDDNVLETLYDNEDSVCGIVYNGVPYYFHKNLQGDIIAIADQDGKVVARYTYDAWGKCEIAVGSVNATIAEINPYRYRSYYFDTETGFYYLQSRYYDPEIGRFINVDEPAPLKAFKMILTTNLFAYSDNDAVNNCDIDGYFTLKSIYKKIKNIITVRGLSVSVKLSRKVSIVFAILTLIYRVFSIVSDVRSIKKMLNNKMATAIVAALPYGTSVVSAEIVAWLCNVGAAAAVLSVILSFFASSCTGGVFEIAKTAALFAISYVAPTMIAAIQMLYYGYKKKRGCTYTVKLLGGSAVSF